MRGSRPSCIAWLRLKRPAPSMQSQRMNSSAGHLRFAQGLARLTLEGLTFDHVRCSSLAASTHNEGSGNLIRIVYERLKRKRLMNGALSHGLRLQGKSKQPRDCFVDADTGHGSTCMRQFSCQGCINVPAGGLIHKLQCPERQGESCAQ